MTEKVPMTLLIASRDEATLLEDRLRELDFCDELIVVDVASSDDTRAALVGTLRSRAQAIAGRRGVHVEWTTRMDQTAVATDARLAEEHRAARVDLHGHGHGRL